MSEKVKEGNDCNDSKVKKALESIDISVIEKAIGMEEGRVSKYFDQIHAILKLMMKMVPIVMNQSPK